MSTYAITIIICVWWVQFRWWWWQRQWQWNFIERNDSFVRHRLMGINHIKWFYYHSYRWYHCPCRCYRNHHKHQYHCTIVHSKWFRLWAIELCLRLVVCHGCNSLSRVLPFTLSISYYIMMKNLLLCTHFVNRTAAVKKQWDEWHTGYLYECELANCIYWDV